MIPSRNGLVDAKHLYIFNCMVFLAYFSILSLRNFNLSNLTHCIRYLVRHLIRPASALPGLTSRLRHPSFQRILQNMRSLEDDGVDKERGEPEHESSREWDRHSALASNLKGPGRSH
ncbi:hypothetical protein L202_06228 [Cryptococcus amylolentus CBS 6039]|uniref:Uncharacterized protein n=1 Tax=Cryptococcus amylolentus CBS 6039 TaxID=1295533 RepID=A0A1E3HLI2_9TREE|nr:hypothetical protein L202_06228 [Cryptococcus amylolentus CBS 6039]ODN76301.1 hypothetical protein L202_06228 [Cryptococcus amylolentus CBS 6039]